MVYQCFIVRYYEYKDGRWAKHISICYTLTEAMNRAGRIFESDHQRLDTIEACY